MRRIRLSTWVLTAIFLAALVAYVLVKPSPESTGGPEQCKHTRSTSPTRESLPPGVIPGTSPHSSSASVSPSGSADGRTRACAERLG
jgi:hypothetical protein